MLSGDTYLRDLIPAAKNDELEEIVLCKKAGGIIRRKTIPVSILYFVSIMLLILHCCCSIIPNIFIKYDV